MNGNLLLTESEEYFIVNEEGLINFPVGLPLDALPDSLPELNFAVEEQLPELSVESEPQHGPPDNKPDPGKYDFHVEINSSHTHKKKYVVSHKLNRIYVDKDIDFPVQFSWHGPPQMYVRATCAFADDAQRQKRVERCLSHYHSSAVKNPVVASNVLHSSRPPGTQGVQYCGSRDSADSWFSVRVAFNKRDTEPATHAYRFTCKNSCTTGINRRAILIIFTLEDQRGTVHGRQIVGARVCACPRRDMVKDEESEGAPRGAKRKIAAPPPPPPTKVKREDNEDAVLNLNLPLLTPRAALAAVEASLRVEEQAYEASREPRAAELLAFLKQKAQDLKDKYPALA